MWTGTLGSLTCCRNWSVVVGGCRWWGTVRWVLLACQTLLASSLITCAGEHRHISLRHHMPRENVAETPQYILMIHVLQERGGWWSRLASDRKVAGSNPSSGPSWAAWQSLLEEDTEPQVAPDVWLAPCMAASAISEDPAMSWRLVQGAPCPRPETSWDWLQQKPPRPH